MWFRVKKSKVSPQDVVVLERFWSKKIGKKVPFLSLKK